jgi:hypothetical protein
LPIEVSISTNGACSAVMMIKEAIVLGWEKKLFENVAKNTKYQTLKLKGSETLST